MNIEKYILKKITFLVSCIVILYLVKMYIFVPNVKCLKWRMEHISIENIQYLTCREYAIFSGFQLKHSA